MLFRDMQAMESLKATIEQIRGEFTAQLHRCLTLADCETVRVKFLGRHGSITTLMHELSRFSLEEKRTVGPLLNQLKLDTTHALTSKLNLLTQQENTGTSTATFDVTASLPGRTYGGLHLFTQMTQKLESIFISMGFDKADGPELETDFYNFQALNIPQDHPARDMQDTFWLTLPHYLMRTHTSSVEVRAMQSTRPPLAIFSIGRTYRHEATDATHDFVFMQCEGLLIDKNVSLSHLLGTLKAFLQQLFESSSLSIRVRPSYFPFTEPSLEVDISCLFCSAGCSVCKQSGWIELGGAGLTHPNVLRACGLNPDIYQGFAWGFGIERLIMLKYGINDIRLLRSNRLDFLQQFA